MADAAGLVGALRARVGDERVLAAIGLVPRDVFVPERLRDRAWENEPLAIGDGQTISQPLAVAHMCELLAVARTDRVLDVGTGSGYHAALLARLGMHVWTIELRPPLAAAARGALDRAGVTNVTARVGDGSVGWPDQAPFDAINVAAAGEEARLTALLEQLAPGGRLVAPVGTRRQTLVRYERTAGGLVRTEHGAVRFVPLLSALPPGAGSAPGRGPPSRRAGRRP